MSRLVVVSNRVAVPGENRAGGLAVGLLAALKERGGLWFGWSGKTVKEGSGTLHRQKDGDIDYVTMDLSKREVDGYYNGFANRTLWPLLHFRLDLATTTAAPARPTTRSMRCSPTSSRHCCARTTSSGSTTTT